MSKDNKNEELEYGREKLPAERRESLPPYLRLSDEQVEEARAENARALADSNSPFLTQSPQDAQRARAIREESDWRRTLASIEFQQKCGDDGVETEMRRRLAAQTLAENLAAQGRFGEASTVSPSDDQAREYLDLAAAVARDDAAWCGPGCDVLFANDPTRLTREDVVAEVFSPPHGRVMPVNRCPYCKITNVRPAAPENVERRKLRARARALTEGQAPERAGETLKREKLTSTVVFNMNR